MPERVDPDPRIRERFQALHRLVGNTPLLAIELHLPGRAARDLREAGIAEPHRQHQGPHGAVHPGARLPRRRIAPGDRIAEATSGNTGISFAAIGRALGHPVTDLHAGLDERRTDVAHRELRRRRSCRSAATTAASSAASRGRKTLAAHDPTVFLPQQFANDANVRAHAETTGPEIWMQLQSAGLTPDAFVAGVGTGGTVMGVGRFLRSRKPGIRIHPRRARGIADALHRPQGRPAPHSGRLRRVHSGDRASSIELDDVIAVHDGDAILMAQQLAQHGLAVGISSGANLLGALKVQDELGPEAVVVTVFPGQQQEVPEHGPAPRSEPRARAATCRRRSKSTGFRAFMRVCGFCSGKTGARSEVRGQKSDGNFGT